jgi:hypothetical protein
MPLRQHRPDRVDALLDAYHHARTASGQTTVAVATITADVRAPSHVLTLARGAISRDSEVMANSEQEPAEPEPHDAEARPGPIERIVHDLGVTNPSCWSGPPP